MQFDFVQLTYENPCAFQSTKEEWENVFCIGAGMFIVADIIFILFGSGYVQEWNNVPDEANAEGCVHLKLITKPKSHEIHKL